MVAEDVGRVNKVTQDGLWFAIWCQFESFEKLVEAPVNAFVLIPNHYLRMPKARDATLCNP